MTRYTVELFGNNDVRSRESERFLDASPVYTDAAGVATFTMKIQGPPSEAIHAVTATVTSEEGATSPLSAALQLKDPSSR